MSRGSTTKWVVVALLVAAVLASSPWLLGVRWRESDAAVVEDLDDAWDRVLQAHVRDGRVGYARLHEDPRALREVVATLAVVGPESTPSRFATREARLAYYMNAYNALVLFAVVESWPIASVHDVRGPLEPVAGFGFFYAQYFHLDGHWINLYELENDVLRERFDDARIHGAIVCASAGCPPLASEPYLAAHLSEQLEEAMDRFCARDVVVARDRIVLSPLFEWYREDFEHDAAGSLLDYVERCAPDAGIAAARERGTGVVFADYDWSLNGR